MKKITIAIDGHSSCGKSTMAKDLAREVGYVYVDTGAMYRSVTLFAIRNGIFTDEGINEAELRRRMPEIRISFKFNAETGRPDTYLQGKPHSRPRFRARGDGSPTAANGQGQGGSDGRTRHRHYRIP